MQNVPNTYDNGEERAQSAASSTSGAGAGDIGDSPSLEDQASAKAEEWKGKAANVKQRVTDAGRRAANTVDSKREPTARALESAANTVRQSGSRVSDATSRASHGTADKLEATANYIRENDLRDMLEDVQDVVRRHPGPALAIAAVAGFLVGKALFTGRD
jgi:ElaB/YqjD/DUF883 family membrane-anchored ribosome-binding protein